MRLSGVAITNILKYRQANFLNGTNNQNTYAYLMYDHRITNYLLSGDISSAEHLLLYDPVFGMGEIPADVVTNKKETKVVPKNEAILKIMQTSFGRQTEHRMWYKFPEVVPPDIPESEDFGVEYEVKYQLPNGVIESTVTEWLWERTWNCIYPVIAWREYNPVVSFDKKKWERPEHVY